MTTKEITAHDLDPDQFIKDQIAAIKATVGNGIVINALSGGVDSSVVTLLGHRAIGDQLKTYFIQNGLVREDEENQVVVTFDKLGVPVDVVYAEDEFFAALDGVIDPEKKREAVTQTFYREVFGRLVKESGAKFLFQGTILTDVDETAAGIKRQHNVFEQIGIDPKKAFGYRIIEPLVQLRKDGVRLIAKALGLPEAVYNCQPFPGPGLAARIKGEVTAEKLEIVRRATMITENALNPLQPFQTMTILNEDRVTGIVNNERQFGLQIEIRCWKSTDARTAEPMNINWDILLSLGRRIPAEIPEVVSVTYQISPKPPCTMEAL
jgi:GMP synthase (glutamine-hydrolysing)